MIIPQHPQTKGKQRQLISTSSRTPIRNALEQVVDNAAFSRGCAQSVALLVSYTRRGAGGRRLKLEEEAPALTSLAESCTGIVELVA